MYRKNKALTDELYTEVIIKKVVTPYKRIRDRLGIPPAIVAEKLNISLPSLYSYENKNRPVPKDVVRAMDKLYGCEGKLIDYWINNDPSSTSDTHYLIKV